MEEKKDYSEGDDFIKFARGLLKDNEALGLDEEQKKLEKPHTETGEILSEADKARLEAIRKDQEERIRKIIEDKIQEKEKPADDAKKPDPKPVVKKSGEASTDLGSGKIGRRGFLKMLGISVAGIALLEGETFVEKLLTNKKKEIREYKGIKVPKFIFEKSAKGSEEFIPKDIISLIDQAKKTIAESGKKPQIDIIKGQQVSSVILATIDISEKKPKIKILEIGSNGEVKDAENDEIDNDEKYEVEVGDKQGASTSFIVRVPKSRLVLATDQFIHLNRKDGKEPIEAIYSPYIQDLDISVIRETGFHYLIDLLLEAKKKLKEKKALKSHVKGANEIAPGMSVDLLIKLAMVEQADPNEFKKRADKIKEQNPKLTQAEADIQAVLPLITKGLTVFGQNRENTKKYAVSDAGASGPFQLMPGPYREIVVETKDKAGNLGPPRYPNSGLNPDFKAGAVDHLNAAQAALLWIDSDLSTGYNNTAIKKLFDEKKLSLGVYLSACYNTGFGNVRDAIEKDPENWVSQLPKQDETGTYIRKFEAVTALFETEQSINLANISNVAELMPPALVGGPTAMAKEAEIRTKFNLELIPTMDRLRELVAQGVLVPLPTIKNKLEINEKELPQDRWFCKPEVRQFLIDMAEENYKKNPKFKPLRINSAVRPLDVQKDLQKKNANASSKSSHPTGNTVDITYLNMGGEQLTSIQNSLIEMEKKGYVQATKELNQACLHIMVSPDYLKIKK